MKIAVLSDIHANWPALKAAVEDSGNVNEYLFVGDFIGLLGYPSEVVQFAIENSDLSVKGNHDISVVENNKGHVNSSDLSEFELRITKNNLNNEQANWISDLKSYQENEKLGVVMSHAKPTPEMSTGLESRNSGLSKGSFTRVASNFDTDLYDYIIVGHTHNQEALDVSKFGHDIVVLNPGTVGSPSNIGVADYAIIDTENRDYELRSVEYDEKEVISRLEDLNVPVRWWI
jgi:predicted phosphodiesterase